MLDGAPIVCIATGLARGSTNTKTGGDLIQTWIIRSDVNPIAASKSGQDSAICGTCPHAGFARMDLSETGRVERTGTQHRTCYVRLEHAPRNVYESYHRGIYPRLQSPEAIAALFAGRGVRLGAYGDPAAVPYKVWETTLSRVGYVTGYTHQWRRFPALARFCMASADSLFDRAQAHAAGFRTFRVISNKEATAHTNATAPSKASGEVTCPASKEAGFRTTCDQCRACGGLSSKARADIVINMH